MKNTVIGIAIAISTFGVLMNAVTYFVSYRYAADIDEKATALLITMIIVVVLLVAEMLAGFPLICYFIYR